MHKPLYHQGQTYEVDEFLQLKKVDYFFDNEKLLPIKVDNLLQDLRGRLFYYLDEDKEKIANDFEEMDYQDQQGMSIMSSDKQAFVRQSIKQQLDYGRQEVEQINAPGLIESFEILISENIAISDNPARYRAFLIWWNQFDQNIGPGIVRDPSDNFNRCIALVKLQDGKLYFLTLYNFFRASLNSLINSYHYTWQECDFDLDVYNVAAQRNFFTDEQIQLFTSIDSHGKLVFLILWLSNLKQIGLLDQQIVGQIYQNPVLSDLSLVSLGHRHLIDREGMIYLIMTAPDAILIYSKEQIEQFPRVKVGLGRNELVVINLNVISGVKKFSLFDVTLRGPGRQTMITLFNDGQLILTDDGRSIKMADVEDFRLNGSNKYPIVIRRDSLLLFDNKGDLSNHIAGRFSFEMPKNVRSKRSMI